MISRTVVLYREAFSGLSPQTWLLSVIMLINRSGTMVVPFMTLYLTRPAIGYSISKAGVVMGLFGLGAVLGAYISGKVTDRLGFYPVQLFTLLVGGVLFIVLGQMKQFPFICLFTFLLSLVNEAFRPANSTAIAFYSKSSNRTRSYALNRLAINLGWACGNAVGGWVASVNYEWLFWLDGITNVLAGLLLWVLLKPDQNGRGAVTAARSGASALVYRDKVYLWFIILTLLFAACFFQLFTNLPAYYRNVLGFSERWIGLIGAVNGVMIAVFEMVMIFKLEGRRSSMFYISLGVALCALGYGLLQRDHFTATWSLVMIVVMTAGEIFSMPFMNSFWISRTSEHNRGQYAALYTMAWATAQTIGPFLGAQLAQYAGFSILWLVLVGVLFLSAAGFYLLDRKLNTQPSK